MSFACCGMKGLRATLKSRISGLAQSSDIVLKDHAGMKALLGLYRYSQRHRSYASADWPILCRLYSSTTSAPANTTACLPCLRSLLLLGTRDMSDSIHASGFDTTRNSSMRNLQPTSDRHPSRAKHMACINREPLATSHEHHRFHKVATPFSYHPVYTTFLTPACKTVRPQTNQKSSQRETLTPPHLPSRPSFHSRIVFSLLSLIALPCLSPNQARFLRSTPSQKAILWSTNRVQKILCHSDAGN